MTHDFYILRRARRSDEADVLIPIDGVRIYRIQSYMEKLGIAEHNTPRIMDIVLSQGESMLRTAVNLQPEGF